MALQQVAFFARPARPTLAYSNTYVSSIRQSSYSFTSVSAGGAGLVIVAWSAQSSDGTGRTLSSSTIDGNAATSIITKTQTFSSGLGMSAGIFAYRRTTSTNFTVTLGLSGNAESCRIGVWRLNDNISDTATHTGSSGSNSVSSLSLTLTSLPLNSVVVAVEGVGETGRRTDWGGGMIEQYDINTGATSGSSGGNDRQNSDGNFTVSLTHSPTVESACALAAAAWI